MGLIQAGGILLAFLAPLYHASPAAPIDSGVHVARYDTELITRDGHEIYKRISTDFSLDQTLENEVLFDGTSGIFGLLPIDAPPVTVVCTKCCTKGDITASLTDDEITNPTLRFDLKGVEAYVELDVVANGDSSFSLPLFQLPPGLLGFAIPSGPSIGLTFQVELVFNVAANLDVHGGFFVQLPEDAFFEASIMDGALTNVSLDGIMSKSLPLTVHNGNSSVTFQVDLQIKTQVGVDTTSSILPVFDSFGIGAQVGVFVNLLEFIAQLEPTDDCQLQATETFDVNVGAFLKADIELGEDKTFGAVPTVSTTLFEAVLGTQCLVSAGLPLPTRSSDLLPAPSCTVTTSASTLPQQSGFFTPTYTAAPTASAYQYDRRTPANETDPVATSTVFSTTTLTITACASALANCPGDLQNVIEITRTVCAAATSSLTGACPTITDATPLSSLTAPATQTFAPGNATASSSSTISVLPTQSAGGDGFLHVNATSSYYYIPSGTGAIPTASVVTVSGAARDYCAGVRGVCSVLVAGLAVFAVVAL